MKGFPAYRRRPPAEPSSREIDLARRWLARRGAPVSVPTRLLSIRIAAHTAPSTWLRTFPLHAVLALAAGVGYSSLQYLPGVAGREMTEAIPLVFVLAAIQLSLWRARRVRERNLAATVPHRRTGIARPIGVVDGWSAATAATTFLGGAALALAMAVAVPGAWTYAWSWLGLLAVGALCTAVVVGATVREPVLAEDDASLAAAGVLRREAVVAAMPAMYAVPVLFDVFGGNRQPAAFTPLLLGYVALCLVLQLGAALAQRRWKLPPGHYGTVERTRETPPAAVSDENVWKPAAR
ncbi:hypothetical protein VSH64_04665 [Amycolatopsis rhabdoformis]|uniref:MFS transporter n=1 Tax=Amycolatopsis rhabdoformis TaxID=1448059 RepID=A0ABZ1IB18_9PSEU|nr:hypothetical protein [Amycolatopsis rhabdoformis]WSE31402.1 hypothetical protein VSH64_04665 [Amycolatopsis rhabdoformis]